MREEESCDQFQILKKPLKLGEMNGIRIVAEKLGEASMG